MVMPQPPVLGLVSVVASAAGAAGGGAGGSGSSSEASCAARVASWAMSTSRMARARVRMRFFSPPTLRRWSSTGACIMAWCSCSTSLLHSTMAWLWPLSKHCHTRSLLSMKMLLSVSICAAGPTGRTPPARTRGAAPPGASGRAMRRATRMRTLARSGCGRVRGSRHPARCTWWPPRPDLFRTLACQPWRVRLGCDCVRGSVSTWCRLPAGQSASTDRGAQEAFSGAALLPGGLLERPAAAGSSSAASPFRLHGLLRFTDAIARFRCASAARWGRGRVHHRHGCAPL